MGLLISCNRDASASAYLPVIARHSLNEPSNVISLAVSGCDKR